MCPRSWLSVAIAVTDRKILFKVKTQAKKLEVFFLKMLNFSTRRVFESIQTSLIETFFLMNEIFKHDYEETSN